MSYFAENEGRRQKTKTRGWCGFRGRVCKNKVAVRILSISFYYRYSQVKCLMYLCSDLEMKERLQNLLWHNILPTKNSPFLLYLLPAPFWLAMRRLVGKKSDLHSQCQEKHSVCMFVCHLTDLWFSTKKINPTVATSGSQLCCLKAVCVTINLREATDKTVAVQFKQC